MTRILFPLLFLLFLPEILAAQGTVEVSVLVYDGKRKALSSVSVYFIETSTGEKIESKTDATGTAKFTVDKGKEWQLYVIDQKMDNILEVPDQGMMQRKMTVTYNPALARRESEQSFDRTGYQWSEQKYKSSDAPLAGKALLKVKVISREGVSQKNVKVNVVNVKEKTGYTASSGEAGIACFMVDLGKKYDIDVEGLLNVSYADVRNRPDLILTVTCFYDKPKVEEQRYGDTIVQRITKEAPASGRAFYTVTVLWKDKTPAANETVYLAELYGKDVYVGYTDASGVVKFMLPLGKKYMVHFNFEKDVDVIDLSNTRGYVSGGLEVTYRPNPKLEHPELFIPGREQLFLVEFENFLQKQYPKPKAPDKVGIFLKWGGKMNANSKEALLEIGYKAQLTGTQTMPGNYSFVIDRSGSMAGYYRLEKLKESLVELAKLLKPDDFVSMVTYDDDMEVIFPHQKLGNNRQALIEAIQKIEAGGGTSMLEAMKKGYEFVMSKYSPQLNNRVILLTDGWDSNQPEVLEAAQQPYNSKINCTAVGVGEDFNYALLQILAEKGRGTLHFVGDSADFNKVFLTDIMKTIQLVGYDVSLEIEYPDKVVFKHLYGKEPLPGSKNPVKYALPSLYDGQNRVALALFELQKPDADIQKTPVKVRIRYKEAVTGKEVVVEELIYPEWEEYTGTKPLVVEAEQKKLYAIAEINRALKVMADAYGSGDNETARKTLEQTMQRMKELYPNAEDEDVKKLMAQMELYLEAFKNLAKKNEIKNTPKKKVK